MGVADRPRLTPASFEQLSEQARQLGLLEDPAAVSLLRCINPARPRRLDQQLFATAEERVNRFAQYLRDTNPFLNARRPAALDGFTLGLECSSGFPLYVDDRDLNRHVLITAPTGGTKTVYAHHLILQARRRGLHVWIADPKRDAEALACRDEDFLIITTETPFNLLH